MAKKWVNAGFKSRGDAMEYCMFNSRVMDEDGTIVFLENGLFKTRKNGWNIKPKFWDSYKKMQIEVDEPELEFGKAYQVSDSENFDHDLFCVVRFREFNDSDLFVSTLGNSWKYYREIPAELIGKIK